MLSEMVTHALRSTPQTIVECGSGISTIAFARCLQINGSGHVYSLEHEPAYAEETRTRLAEQGLSDWATVVDAPLVPQEIEGEEWNWYATDNIPEGPIDVIFVDGPPEPTGPMARYPAKHFLFDKLSADGVAFIDDADKVDGKKNIDTWRRESPELTIDRLRCEKGGARISYRAKR